MKAIAQRNSKVDEYRTIISAEEVLPLLGKQSLVFVDCRYNLQDHEKGKQDYLLDHIPGAVYAHLKYDLAGPVVSGKTSRHPLPDIQIFSGKLSDWGIDSSIQVVAYDDNNGSMAARLWWLLKWLGHDKVAGLDGGYDCWKKNGFPVSTNIPSPEQKTFVPHPHSEMLVNSKEVLQNISSKTKILIDSRDEERYRGAIEPIDPIAGHIPGAENHFYMHNVDTSGKFKPPSVLKNQFLPLAGNFAPEDVIFYCGSGVTGAHNVLAYYHAGLGLPKLYAGSWSEWITKPDHPISSKEREKK